MVLGFGWEKKIQCGDQSDHGVRGGGLWTKTPYFDRPLKAKIWA